jgi:hypothetical protein
LVFGEVLNSVKQTLSLDRHFVGSGVCFCTGRYYGYIRVQARGFRADHGAWRRDAYEAVLSRPGSVTCLFRSFWNVR